MTNSEKITCDAGNLYRAFLDSRKSSPKKYSTKRMSQHVLDEIKRAQDELHNRTWTIEKLKPFIIYERGHKRKIEGNTPYDRMIIHSFIDNYLFPKIQPFLMYDNYASQAGKGPDMARQRFEDYMHQCYRKYGTNHFFVLIIDFSNFYDNFRHDKLMRSLDPIIHGDDFAIWFIETILKSFEVDVSYMTDEEYAVCLDEKYVALDHIDDPPEMHTGEKFMKKSINIGNQGSQDFSIFLPTPIDNYIKIVKGIPEAGRYMDDYSVMNISKEYLWKLLDEIRPICKELGLFINEKKTQVYPAWKCVKYLNRRYTMTDTGHLIITLSPSTVTRERRKLKKMKGLMENGEKSYKEIENQYKSWIRKFAARMSKKQIRNMDDLFNDLFVNPFIRGVKNED